VVSDFCEAKIVSNHANLMAHPSIHFAHKIRKTLRASGGRDNEGLDDPDYLQKSISYGFIVNDYPQNKKNHYDPQRIQTATA
jgi:hypothetical protein